MTLFAWLTVVIISLLFVGLVFAIKNKWMVLIVIFSIIVLPIALLILNSIRSNIELQADGEKNRDMILEHLSDTYNQEFYVISEEFKPNQIAGPKRTDNFMFSAVEEPSFPFRVSYYEGTISDNYYERYAGYLVQLHLENEILSKYNNINTEMFININNTGAIEILDDIRKEEVSASALIIINMDDTMENKYQIIYEIYNAILEITPNARTSHPDLQIYFTTSSDLSQFAEEFSIGLNHSITGNPDNLFECFFHTRELEHDTVLSLENIKNYIEFY